MIERALLAQQALSRVCRRRCFSADLGDSEADGSEFSRANDVEKTKDIQKISR